jgi:NAD(P)H-hydrate epimerase
VSGEIITVAQMRAIDARSADLGVPTRQLMENAGAAVAREVQARWPARPTVIFCGPGANGGDGFVAARKLAEAGWPVRVGFLGDRRALQGDAADASSAWMGWVDPATPDLVEPGVLVIDALFGAGLTRPLDADAALIARAARGSDIVAIDLPSGVQGDGEDIGGETFRADLTVAFVRKKRAHVLEPWRSLCGAIVVADIGEPAAALDVVKGAPMENGPGLWTLPWPAPVTHKHARGHAMAVSGGPGHRGAARLAARGALRVGAGLVTLITPSSAARENAQQLTAIMLETGKDAVEIRALAAACDAAILGPAAGVNANTREAALAIAGLGKPLVLDADALSIFEGEPASLFKAAHAGVVLTPHPGEFRRLFPDLATGEGSRIEKVRAAAKRAGCVVLLKGPDTVIASPDARCAVNTTGTPFLATAGSGDVLAGFIGGLMAQGLAAFEAAAAGAWLHGRVGERLGPGLTAEDLPEALPALLNELAPAILRCRP